jgi:membrane-associated phospholipid phosphatase
MTLKYFKGIFEGRTTFFVLYTIILLVGIVALNIVEHGEETLFFSRNHSEFLDTFFTFGTRMGEPYAYAFFGVCLIFVRYGYALLLPLIGITVTVVSEVLKKTFPELRPYNFFNDMGRISELNFVKGIRIFQDFTAFPSGHTMSGFAIYGFLALVFGKKPFYQVFFLLCAFWVGFSRMYLLQHFLNDVLAGSLVGIYLAMLFYYLHLKYSKNDSFWAKKLRISL